MALLRVMREELTRSMRLWLSMVSVPLKRQNRFATMQASMYIIL